jgi:hypothetical protein
MRHTGGLRSRPRAEWIKLEDETGAWYFNVETRGEGVEFIPKTPMEDPSPTEHEAPAPPEPLPRARFSPVPRSVVAQISEINKPNPLWRQESWQRTVHNGAGLFPIFNRATKQFITVDGPIPDA